MTKDEVTRVWGGRFGRCRDCEHATWYFNYRPFLPDGAGVAFERSRVSHVFTVWQPDGWRTPEGLILGDPAADIARTYGPLDRRECGRYYALVEPGARGRRVCVLRLRRRGLGVRAHRAGRVPVLLAPDELSPIAAGSASSVGSASSLSAKRPSRSIRNARIPIA